MPQQIVLPFDPKIVDAFSTFVKQNNQASFDLDSFINFAKNFLAYDMDIVKIVEGFSYFLKLNTHDIYSQEGSGAELHYMRESDSYINSLLDTVDTSDNRSGLFFIMKIDEDNFELQLPIEPLQPTKHEITTDTVASRYQVFVNKPWDKATKTLYAPINSKFPSSFIENSILQKAANATGLLPPGVLWVGPSNRSFIVQHPPKSIQISYSQLPLSEIEDIGSSNLDHNNITLNMPWQIYGLFFNSDWIVEKVYVWFAKEQISSTEDLLYNIPITNRYLSGDICLSDESDDNMFHYIRSLKDLGINDYDMPNFLIDTAINEVWTSNFNADLTASMNFRYMPDSFIKTYLNNTDRHDKSPLNYTFHDGLIADFYKIWKDNITTVDQALECDWVCCSQSSSNVSTIGDLIEELLSFSSGSYYLHKMALGMREDNGLLSNLQVILNHALDYGHPTSTLI